MSDRGRPGDPKRAERVTPPAARPRPGLSLAKKALFSLVVTVVFFLLLELVLAIAGVEPILYEEDPYLGFSSRIPLFVEEESPEDGAYLVTAENKLQWFNRQRFPEEKPSGTYRIFCLGGSTTYGRPYGDRTSFCGWLRELLPAADGSRRWEVINAGGISYASYRVAMLTEELIRYEPDLFVIYSGHNEFLERRTYASIIETPPAVRGLGALLSRTRTYSALGRLLRARTEKPSAASSRRDDLPGEVEALLDESVGPEAYSRDDAFQTQVLSHFRFNLARTVDIARSGGARVILVTPASNLQHCSPFKSEHRTGLADAERRGWQALFDRAGTALAAGRFDEALRALDEAAAIDGRHAHAHYLRGSALRGLGRHADAKQSFTRARDEDICPLRALTPMRKIVAEIAADREVPLVDFVAVVESRSEHAIAGEGLFLDHVHPTIEGNRLLALAVFDEMVSQGLLSPRPSWDEGSIRQVIDKVESTLDRRSHAIALRNLAKVLGWAGKFEESRKLALRAVEMLPDDADAHHLAGQAFARLGDLERAAAHCKRALEIEPDHAEAHIDLGIVLQRQGNRAEAAAHYERALRVRPGDARAHYNLGVVLQKGGDLARAANHFQQALDIDPDYLQAHNNLGLVFEKQGNLVKAAHHYEQALDIDPDYLQAHNNLGVVFGKRGDLVRAVSHLESALRINPEYAQAHYNLGHVLELKGNLEQAVSHYRQAFKQAPTPLSAVDHLAWILATNGDPTLRDGKEALRWARYCAEATGFEHAVILNTLAAACAEAGDFDEAVRWQTKAVELIPAANKAAFAERLELYRAGKPYRSERGR